LNLILRLKNLPLGSGWLQNINCKKKISGIPGKSKVIDETIFSSSWLRYSTMPFLSLWILVRQNDLGLESFSKFTSSRKNGSCAALSLLVGMAFLLEVGIYGREPCNNSSILYLTIQVKFNYQV